MAGSTSQFVDFSNVKDGGNFNKGRIPAGDYLATITKVEDAPSKKDEIPQYLFSIKIDKRTQSVFPYYCKLQENQLWKLRNILIAGGITVPKRKVKVDPNKLVGKKIGVTIEDTDYEGKEQSEISGVFPAAELGDLDDPSNAPADEPEDDDEDLDDAPATRVQDAQVDDDEEVEEEAEEEEPEAEEEPEEEEPAGDEYDEMDRLALRKELKKLSPDTKTSTKQTDDDLRVLIRSLVAKAAPAKAAPAPAAKAKAAAKKPAATVTDDELEELDIDSL